MIKFPVHIGPYTISVGHCGSADCCLCLDDKEYLIESPAWNLLEHVMYNRVSAKYDTKLLRIIYENMDNDVRSHE